MLIRLQVNMKRRAIIFFYANQCLFKCIAGWRLIRARQTVDAMGSPDMRGAARDAQDDPDIQVLMCSVIRLMALCNERPDGSRVQALLQFMRKLRAHPELDRHPAVLASLAEANFVWQKAMRDIVAS
ncbi:MAG: hypothetical protein KDC48_22595, partial [Planctomycetes bacterium]|nr:hypothetical protein [Planctomycetota bacterium]